MKKLSMLDLTLVLVSFLLAAYWLYSGFTNSRDQGIVLAQIESAHNPKASAFVEAWRETHSSPSDKELTDLRLMAERIRADPNVAEKYTADLARAKANQLTFAQAYKNTLDWMTSQEGFAVLLMAGLVIIVFAGYRIFLAPRY